MDRDLTILFDESGSPTFSEARESNFFIGVTITYNSASENKLFIDNPDLFSLNSTQPKKNRKLKLSQIEKIGEFLLTNSVQWSVFIIDLANEELQEVTKVYHEYSNCLRLTHRNVRNRSIAQILYNQIVADSIFYSIQYSLENEQTNTSYQIYLDDWSFSPNDEGIVLEITPRSMMNRSNEILDHFNITSSIKIGDFTLLSNDSPRKRIIDTVTSTSSRAFLPSDDKNYSEVIRAILNNEANETVRLKNITYTTIEFFREFMDQSARSKK